MVRFQISLELITLVHSAAEIFCYNCSVIFIYRYSVLLLTLHEDLHISGPNTSPTTEYLHLQ